MIDKVVLFCSCVGEGLIVSNWSDEYDGFQIGVSLWRYGASYRYGLRWKLYHIWNIIKYGHPYTDDILLDRENTQKLADTLNKILGEDNVSKS